MNTQLTDIIGNRKTKFGFYHALLFIAIANLIYFLIGATVEMSTHVLPGIKDWFIFISYTVTFLLSLALVRRWTLVVTFDTNKVGIIVYLVLIPLVIALAIILESIVSLIPMPESVRILFEQALQINFQGFLTLCIAAPVLEELIFRGIILKKFLEKYPPKMAIILSAVIFGIAHLNPWQFVAAFAIGTVIGWIYWKTRSIWPGIFIHFVNNTFSFYLAKKFQGIEVTFKDIIGSNFYYISLLLLCLLISYTIYLILKKYFEKASIKQNPEY